VRDAGAVVLRPATHGRLDPTAVRAVVAGASDAVQRCYDRAVARDPTARGELEVLTDFQLQIEHVLDLEGREEVFFVDAEATLERDFAVRPLDPQPRRGFTTHAMTPPALMRSFEEVLKTKAPLCFVIAIGGESFELGAALSASAAAHLEAALEAFTTRRRTARPHAS
jgi:hypothetical protein